jgi:hypothetical protein
VLLPTPLPTQQQLPQPPLPPLASKHAADAAPAAAAAAAAAGTSDAKYVYVQSNGRRVLLQVDVCSALFFCAFFFRLSRATAGGCYCRWTTTCSSTLQVVVRKKKIYLMYYCESLVPNVLVFFFCRWTTKKTARALASRTMKLLW